MKSFSEWKREEVEEMFLIEEVDDIDSLTEWIEFTSKTLN